MALPHSTVRITVPVFRGPRPPFLFERELMLPKTSTVSKPDTNIVIANWDQAKDLVLARRYSDILTKHYPNHSWGVNVNSSQGMINITNFNFSGKFGYRIRMSELHTHEDEVRVMIRAGGEILERFHHPRKEFRPDIHVDGKKDFRGNRVFDQ